MDDASTEQFADVSAPVGATERPAHFATPAEVTDEEPAPRRRWAWAILLVVILLLVALVVAWAVDASSDEVARNVQLAGTDIGGLRESELAGPVGAVAEDFSTTPVELVTEAATYETSTGALGLEVDKEATTTAALDVGEDVPLPLKPFAWFRSLFSERDAPLELQVNADQVATTVLELEGDARIAPTEPTIELVDGQFRVVPGVDGTGIDPAEVAERLPKETTEDLGTEGVVRLEIEPSPIPPQGSDEEAQAAADAAEALVSEPVDIQTSAGTRTITSDQLRSWVRLATTPEGEVDVRFDQAAVAAELRSAFADIEGHPVDAGFTLQGGTPVVIPDQTGRVCCADDSAEVVLETLRSGERVVILELVDGPASFTAAEAQEYGITQAVGGNNAWRDGAPTTAGPGFTTYHDPSGARITNIHRIADLVRGAVIAPGASFSINDHVGQRTADKGFVSAGAIRNGEHVDEIGGGVSQFATTTFNAAYFAGLPINEYQAHSEYFDRYPRGREATMGFPAPDLVFTNDTPYGIMIWTSYTQSSLTVTLYSTPHATAAQTGSREAPAGKCTQVTTTRTITYPDGRTAQDEFSARYRPSGSTTC